ncbi:MAG: glycosyltransferase family 4 protein [Halioglobus sp.]|nr:glycosyltransferase family 4 protein [Halioglobus sp.]
MSATGSLAAAGPRIGVDARPLCHPGTGIYRYTRELLLRMCRRGGEWFLYSPQRFAVDGLDLPNVHHRSAAVPSALRAGQLAHVLFPLWARRDRIEVFWGPRHQLPLLAREVRAALTIHDLVWKDYGTTMRFGGRQIENFFTPRALARADAIAVVSQFTRHRLEHYFPQCASRVTVVPNASMLAGEEPAGEPAAPGTDAYFLFVGTLEPRKNLPRLLRAYRRYLQDAPRARALKIVGGSGWGGEDIAGLVRELGLAQQVQLLGRVDDAALLSLYRGAHALLMPSLYEGFGLPVVEALSLGIPVMVSRDSAMAEVAGSAGLCVDPQSEDEMAHTLDTLCRDAGLYARLRQQTLIEAGRYSWEQSAALMAGLLFQ